VVSSKTAQDVTSILKKVVQEDGTGKMAFIEGYQVAGKTGTAQKAEPGRRGYAEDKYVASFMGFVPAEDPQLAALVVINEPKSNKYGGVVAAPVFREMIQKTLICLNIPPRKPIFANNLGEIHRRSTELPKGEKNVTLTDTSKYSAHFESRS
jgi:cell division protein FtsI (penicillin-binding protein 3)